MSDENDKQESGLTDKNNGLETLFKKKSGQDRVSVMGDQVIPILDDLVSAEDFDETQTEGPVEEGLENQLDDIAEIVEQKLSSELDEIVNILKGNLKNSIIHELHDQIKKEPEK
jgi:hypothetical protein